MSTTAFPTATHPGCAGCGGPLVTLDESPFGDAYPEGHRLVCAICGTSCVGTDEEFAQAETAREAWDDYHRDTRWKSGSGDL